MSFLTHELYLCSWIEIANCPTENSAGSGGRDGRTTNNLLVFESDPDNAIKLRENCNLNHFRFNVEDCAISKTELLQKEWITKSKELINNNELQYWKTIKIISWFQMKNKYRIIFDTLLADCEGALYCILQDKPDV